MYILEEVKAKFNRICRLIASKFSSNKNKPITNNKSSNNKNQTEVKINRFGFPIDIEKTELNKRK
tara:strand:- start:1801 stop:1995 length:195 start_codon:yes stop_codon:yes gene_type:complete